MFELARWAALAMLCILLPLRAGALPLSDFESSLDGWVVLGQQGSVSRVTDKGLARRGQGALAYRYEVAEGAVQVLLSPLQGASLAGAQFLVLSVKPSELSTVLLSLEEQGGGRWTAPAVVLPGTWNDLKIPLASFVLAQGADDPVDPNGRLDLERVRQISVLDAAAMLVAQSERTARMFSVPLGSRRMLIDDIGFAKDGGAATGQSDTSSTSSTPRRVDRLAQTGFGGMALGIKDIRRVSNQGPGHVAMEYAKGPGLVMTWMQPVSPGTFRPGDVVQLTLGASMATELVFKVEQANGDKFETRLNVAANGSPQTIRVALADLERSDDSGSRRSQAKPEEITQIVLLDAGGWFASKGVNQLSVWGMSAQGGTVPVASAKPAGASAVPTMQVRTPGWATWSKRSQPIHSGPYSLVGDPSVIKDGQRYRMYYTCYDPRRKGPAICQATSEQGYEWTDVKVSKPVPGLMVEARPGRWDDAHETPYAIKYKGTYFLYFVGYRDKGGFAKSFPAYLGLATSTDGVQFTRLDEPILKTTPQGYDNDAVFSPSIVEYQGELVMIYTGHCWTNCPKGKGVFLLAATSRDGKTWVKRPSPILDKKALPSEVKDGAAESEIVLGPDGQYYLFMSWLYGNGTHDIGVARSASPFGPWEVNPLPIVKRPVEQKGFDDVGPIAPSVLIEGDRVRMWFHGFSKRKSIEIGYAEAPWPLKLPP